MKGRLPWEISRVHSVSHFFTTMPQMGGGCKVDFALSSTQVFILPTLLPLFAASLCENIRNRKVPK